MSDDPTPAMPAYASDTQRTTLWAWYTPAMRRMITDTFNGKAFTPVALRQSIEAYVAKMWGGERQPATIPDNIKNYVDKTSQNAYKVVDEDVDALKAAGYSEDQIYEITIMTAVGAGLARVERALTLLNEEVPDAN